MSGGILLVDSLILRKPKATAEQIRSEIIKRVNKHNVSGENAQEAFDYLEALVVNGNIVSCPKPLTLYQKISLCRTSSDVLSVFSELKEIEKINPNLKLFYEPEFTRMLAKLKKEENAAPQIFLDTILKNSNNVRDLRDIQNLIKTFGNKNQINRFNKKLRKSIIAAQKVTNALLQAENASQRLLMEEKTPFKSAKDSWQLFIESGKIPENSEEEIVETIVETVENKSDSVKETTKKSGGKWGWIVLGAVLLAGIITVAVRKNKNKQQNQFNTVA